MTNPLTEEELARLEGLHAKATPGEWEADSEKSDGCYGSGEDCHEGYLSFYVCAPSGEKICDALNSDVGCVHEEFDEDGCCYAWDDVAKHNMAFIIAAKNAFPRLIAAIRADRVRADKAEDMVGAAYQFAGNVLDYAGLFEHDEGQRALDYFCGNVEDADFRWPAADLPPNMATVVARAEAAEAEVARLREIADAVAYFGKHCNWALGFDLPTYGDDDNQEMLWLVTEEKGPINDREWSTVASGATPVAALVRAHRARKALGGSNE